MKDEQSSEGTRVICLLLYVVLLHLTLRLLSSVGAIYKKIKRYKTENKSMSTVDVK